LKDQIVRHYDELSRFYQDVWGVHIHHGYWNSGTETKEEAQEQLIRELASRAKIMRGCRILDVGCGLGGSAIFLSKTLGASVMGITLSPIQVTIGNDLARACGADVRLVQMDAEQMTMEDRFDVAWSVEAISHMNNKSACFRAIARLLDRGGTFVIADWFKSATATAAEEREFLEPIERSMLVPKLQTQCAYVEQLSRAGLRMTACEDFSAKVVKTWELAGELIRKRALWKFAATRGTDFVAFLNGFAAMRAGYKSKALIYGAVIAQTP
jgi:tocopherol O-methyltransferase